jgi:hypothetical protein
MVPCSLAVPGLAEKRPSVLVGKRCAIQQLRDLTFSNRGPNPCSAARNAGGHVV